jgi:K+-transporting ATPase c subunit
MEASQQNQGQNPDAGQNPGNGNDQREDPAASALEGGDPSQSASSELTDEQREQAESGRATQGEQAGEVPGQDATQTGQGFDPNAPVRNAPPSPDETAQAAAEGRTQAPDATGSRPEGQEAGAGEPSE